MCTRKCILTAGHGDRIDNAATRSAFFLGAVNKVIRSAAVSALCAVVGFAFGVGATLFMLYVQCREANLCDQLNELVSLTEQRRELDDRIRSRYIHTISGILEKNCDDVLIWDGKRFSVKDRK